MRDELKFNICELESSYCRNEEIPDLNDRISRFIPEALQYSSLFWTNHLDDLGSSTSGNSDVKFAVSSFVTSTKFLFWLEALSLLEKDFYTCELALDRIDKFFVVCP